MRPPRFKLVVREWEYRSQAKSETRIQVEGKTVGVVSPDIYHDHGGMSIWRAEAEQREHLYPLIVEAESQIEAAENLVICLTALGDLTPEPEPVNLWQNEIFQRVLELIGEGAPRYQIEKAIQDAFVHG